jgi:hypothetical protein
MDGAPEDCLLPIGHPDGDRIRTLALVSCPSGGASYDGLRAALESRIERPLKQWKDTARSKTYRHRFCSKAITALEQSGCFLSLISERESVIREQLPIYLGKLDCSDIAWLSNINGNVTLAFADSQLQDQPGRPLRPRHHLRYNKGAVLVWMAHWLRSHTALIRKHGYAHLHLITDNISGDSWEKGSTEYLQDLCCLLSYGPTRGRMKAGYISTPNDEWMEIIADNFASACNRAISDPSWPPGRALVAAVDQSALVEWSKPDEKLTPTGKGGG